MNNRELYRRSFDKLQPSDKLEKEIITMMNKNTQPRRFRPRRLIALTAAVMVMLSLAVMASATEGMDIVQVWINETLLGQYTYELTDGSSGEVSYQLDGNGDTAVENVTIDLTAPVYAYTESRPEGQFLCVVESETQQMLELDITAGLSGGSYSTTINAFGYDCAVSVTQEADGVILSFEVLDGE